MTARLERFTMALRTVFLLLFVFLWAALPGPAAPQSGSAEEAAPQEQAVEAAEEVEVQDPAAAAQPGEHHEHLKRHLGPWTFTMRIWTGLETEPLTIEGSAEARSLLGGRFVETVYRGEIGGVPFEARAVDGYDNLAEKYERVWQDTFGTYTLLYDGTCTDEGLSRSLTAPFQGPASGSRLRNRVDIRFLEDGSYEHKSYILAGAGEPFLNMELTAVPAQQ
jgi:hypothetical protein